ncbi:MAG: insulinase family protein [Treponema sp.]|nr:insulinase family protein [Treponema sp.]
MKKTVFLKGLLCCILSSLVNAQSNYVLEQDVGKVHIMTMPNGFTVFVREDSSSAILHAEFLCRAGYSSQTPSNAGFFPLYTQLFLSSSQTEDMEIYPSCNADSATYTTDMSPDRLKDFLDAMAACAQKPDFKDNDIQKQYSLIKAASESQSKDASSFINCAIDSHVFEEAPWKTESGVYPALFSGYTVPEVRTILSDIGKRFYTPDNCALFITGNINADDAYKQALSVFGKWKNTGSGITARSSDALKNELSTSGRKFVLADNEFSKDLTQIVIQYTSLSSVQADILGTAFNFSDSDFVKLMTTDSILGIRSKDYIYAESVQRGNSSRLVIQALLEQPYSFAPRADGQPDAKNVNPAMQAQAFASHINEAGTLSTKQFSRAKNTVEARYRAKIGSAVSGMQILADYWAANPTQSDDGYYQKYLNLPKLPAKQDAGEISRTLASESPYIFVLVNTDVWNKNKKAFEALGYTVLTRETASWYHNEIAVKQALDAEKKAEEEKKETFLPENSTSTLSSPMTFYYENASRINDYVLDNGIPLYVKENKHSQTVAISLGIAGGETVSPKNEGLLRTVLVNTYARVLQDEITRLRLDGKIFGNVQIQSRTDMTMSYVEVECVKTDITQVLSAMVHSLIYNDISPVTADRLVNEQKAQRASTLIVLDNQMEYDTLHTLYRGTAFESFYDQNADVLKTTDLHSLEQSYTDFLDASLYSIAISGDVSSSYIQVLVSETFGVLREQSQRKDPVQAEPTFSAKSRRIKLHHYYTSNLTKEDAGDEVPVLVPTSEYYDPVQYYFKAPEDPHEINIYNCLLAELRDRIQPLLPTDTKCMIKTASVQIKTGSLRINGILYPATFMNAYKKARVSLVQDLSNNPEKLVEKLKSKWIQETMIQTQTNTGTVKLMQQGLREKRPFLYLENYLSMYNALPVEFSLVLEKYITETPALTVTSVDSK